MALPGDESPRQRERAPAYAVKIPATAVGPRNSNSKLQLLRRVTVAFPGISGGGGSLPDIA